VASEIRVIIINYNAGEALLKCVASVLNSQGSFSVLVADNQSTDSSCEGLRSQFGSAPSLQIVENPANLGFGPAVNSCARGATEPFLLVLNPDCELFPDTLQQLRQALDRDPEAALAAPTVQDHEGRVLRGTLRRLPDVRRALISGTGMWRLAAWFPRLFTGFSGVEVAAQDFPAETARVEAVSGACMLVRTDDFLTLGGFDESFKMHFEDLDLMARIRKSGRYCLLVPTARVVHLQGVSSASRPLWVHWQKHRGMQLYFRRHVLNKHGLLTRALVYAANGLHYLLGFPLALVRQWRA
jgi:N-acetylglucosaminyl-diphospho-decaprenol L-rhamnosyltransferase